MRVLLLALFVACHEGDDGDDGASTASSTADTGPSDTGTEALARTGLVPQHSETVTVSDGSPFRKGWRLEPDRMHHFFVYFETGATTRMNVTAFSPLTSEAPNGKPIDAPQGVSLVHLPLTVDHTREVTLRVEPLHSRGVKASVVYMTGPLPGGDP